MLEWLHHNGFGPLTPWQEHLIIGAMTMNDTQIQITLPLPPEITINSTHHLIGQTTQVKSSNTTGQCNATIQAVIHDRTQHTLTLRLNVDTPPPIDPDGWELAHPLDLPTTPTPNELNINHPLNTPN